MRFICLLLLVVACPFGGAIELSGVSERCDRILLNLSRPPAEQALYGTHTGILKSELIKILQTVPPSIDASRDIMLERAGYFTDLFALIPSFEVRQYGTADNSVAFEGMSSTQVLIVRSLDGKVYRISRPDKFRKNPEEWMPDYSTAKEIRPSEDGRQ